VDDLIKEFLAESNEGLERMDSELVKLESDPGSAELLASVFRTIHTIKGTCGFLGFEKLGSVAHAGESVLSRMRDGQLALTPTITSVLLEMVDAIRSMLGEIANSENDGDGDYSALIERLKKAQIPATELRIMPITEESSPPPVANETEAPAVPTGIAPPAPPLPELAVKKKHPEAERLGAVLVEHNWVKAEELALALEKQEGGDSRALGEILSGLGAVTEQHLQEALAIVNETKSRATAGEASVRVNVTLLDRLMNLVGELVLARNQILKFSAQQDDSILLGTLQRLSQVTTELREGVMKTRMQPISKLFDKVPRLVRDVSVSCGKQVRIEVEGGDTELDRTLIEAINDPLTHLVRNAIDHGIEKPEQRAARGKACEGLLRLRALHEGGQVTVEISEDGAGIDVEKIRAKSIERGAISADQASRMSPAELLNLIFLPGVSTAEKVTNVSGRGVGMDVVKTNIERVGGSVEVISRPGEGTTFKLRVPLTLAIVPALIARCAGKCFAIPQMNLVELVRLEGEGARKGIEWVHGAPVYRLRGRLLPLVELRKELQLGGAGERLGEGAAAINIVVLQVDSRCFGLIVDHVNDTEEIVVKPLSEHLKGIRAYAGVTIMGDGKLALILDVPGLALNANVSSESRDRAANEDEVSAPEQSNQKQKLVLFAGSGGSRMALPLSTLARLEEFQPDQIEHSGKEWVAQYRGQILPLIRINEALEERRQAEKAEAPSPGERALQVLVLSHEGRTFGLVVDQILDIVDATTDVRLPATRAGVLYSAVVAERVTELLDVPAILHAGQRELSAPCAAEPAI
jgi:two-component system chemotaxis sensor kinase CheA